MNRIGGRALPDLCTYQRTGNAHRVGISGAVDFTLVLEPRQFRLELELLRVVACRSKSADNELMRPSQYESAEVA